MKNKLSVAILIAFSQGVLAQQPPVGGSQLQQIPPAPEYQKSSPEIKLKQSDAPATPEGEQVRILVNSLRITDARVFTEAQLLLVTNFKAGSELTLADLRGMAARITRHYRSGGYFVAQAYLPAQDIKDGVVTIRVLEGQYGKVTLRNEANLPDSLPGGLLEGLNSGDTIASAPLESRLLLLSDIPGVEVKSTLVPGATVGASDLLVQVTPGRSVTGSVEADNAGNIYTGEYRVGASVNFNNISGHGDVLGFRGLTSGSGMKYGRVFYQAPVGKATLGVAYTALEYRLGKEFSSLGAHGTAEVASIYGSYPLIRSRNTNLYALAGYDAKTFEDRVDATSTVTDKRADVGYAGLHGNHRDLLGGGGLSTYGLTWSFGDIDIRTPAALAADQLTARSNGNFNKLAFNVSRVQIVTDTVSLYGAINGQLASKNLDISEKIGLGGMYGVRAYPQGEAYGDEGYIATLEARLLLRGLMKQVPGRVHLIGFVDTGTVTINKNPWAATDDRRTLSAAGVGITWADYNNFLVRAYYAHKLGNAVAVSAPDENSRFWIQLVKYF